MLLNKLYNKSELWFAILWIIAYVVFASVGDVLSEEIGISKVVTLPILLALSIILFVFVKKNKLMEIYGLCRPQISSVKMLFYFPLIILLSANLWFGVRMNMSAIETVLYVLSMLLVGFLEEMIFRGFLFNAMAKNSVKAAIIVSSITFGVGHIVNLINGSGAELIPNILQVIYAIAVGFAFVMIFYKTKSMISCILTHSLFNAISAFSNESIMSLEWQIFSGVIIAVIAGGYALYIALCVKKKDGEKTDIIIKSTQS